MLKVTKLSEEATRLWVATESGKEIGSFVMYVSGFYYWEQNSNGWYAAHSLREIADLLDDVNEPHNKRTDEFFKKEQNG